MADYLRLLREDIEKWSKGNWVVENDNLLYYLRDLEIALNNGQIGGGVAIYNGGSQTPVTQVATSLRFAGTAIASINASGSDVTITINGSTANGGGDMYRNVYDTDLDAVVDSAEKIVIAVKNDKSFTLTKGTIVYIASTSSSTDTPAVELANAGSEATSSKTIGAIFDDISPGAVGKIITHGELHGNGAQSPLDTSMYDVGTKLWLSTVDGKFTSTLPAWPNHGVFIGHVTRKQNPNGRILFAIQNGFEVNELHNVYNSGLADKDLFVYNTTSTPARWENKQLSDILGYTPLAPVTITGSTATKITYSSNGLVTAGAQATTGDISESVDKRYVTNVQYNVVATIAGTANAGQVLKSSGTGSVTWGTDNDTTYNVVSESITVGTSSGGSVKLVSSTNANSAVNIVGAGSTSVSSTGNNTIVITGASQKYPTSFAWTSNAYTGATGTLTLNDASTVSYPAMPVASSNVAGVVFAGVLGPNTKTATGFTISGNDVTFSFTIDHGFRVGDSVTTSGFATGINGTNLPVTNETHGTQNQASTLTVTYPSAPSGASSTGSVAGYYIQEFSGKKRFLSDVDILNGSQTPQTPSPKLTVNTIQGSSSTANASFYDNLGAGTLTIANGMTTGSVGIATTGTANTNINIGHTGSITTINGNLVVNGTQTTLNSTTVAIADKNIELGVVTNTNGVVVSTTISNNTVVITSSHNTSAFLAGQTVTQTAGTAAIPANTFISGIVNSSAFTLTNQATATVTAATVGIGGSTDNTADGGGIILKAATNATDKTILYNNANKNWDLSENVNIPDGKSYKINNVNVLSNNAVLGYTIGGVSGSSIVTTDGAQTLTNKKIGNASSVVITDTNGLLATSTVLSQSRGGTGYSTFNTGDIIYADGSATPSLTKLGIGTVNQVLTANASGLPEWKNNPSGFTNPMNAAGDLIVGGVSGAAGRLGAGTSGQVLIINSTGYPQWNNNPSGFTDPMNAAGDIIYRNSTNNTTRLPVGNTGQVLTVTASGVVNWANATAGFSDPMTAAGDMIIRNATNQTSRINIGTNGQYLVVSNNLPVWQSLDGDLTAIANIADTATGVLVKTGANAWALNSNVLYTTSNLNTSLLVGNVAFNNLPQLFIGGTPVTSASANASITNIISIAFPNSSNTGTTTLQQSPGSVSGTVFLPSVNATVNNVTLAITQDIKDSSITINTENGIYIGTTSGTTATTNSFSLNQSNAATFVIRSNANSASENSTLVIRNSTGGFFASTITANLIGTANVASNVVINNDITTTSTVYPLWVYNTTTQPVTISSGVLSFVPNTGTLTTKALVVSGLGAGFAKTNSTGGVSNVAIAYSDLPNTTGAHIVGNTVTGTPIAMNSANATSMLELFSTTNNNRGLVVGSNGLNASYFMSANGSWLIPPGGSSGNTANSLIIKINTGGTENSNLFTFNGGTAKTIDFKAGNNITLDTSVAGTVTINASGGSTPSTNANVTAGTDTQGNVVLSSGINIITSTPNNPFSSVTLQTASAGTIVTVVNKGSVPLKIYPNTSAFIDSLAVNIPIFINVGQSVTFTAYSGTQWQSSLADSNNQTTIIRDQMQSGRVITGVSASSNGTTTVTFTTPFPHGLLAGDYITAFGFTGSFNITKVQVATATAGSSTFTVTYPLAIATATSTGGSLRTGIWRNGLLVTTTSSTSNVTATNNKSVIRVGNLFTVNRDCEIEATSIVVSAAGGAGYVFRSGIYEMRPDSFNGDLLANSEKTFSGASAGQLIQQYNPTIPVKAGKQYMYFVTTGTVGTTSTASVPGFVGSAYGDATFGFNTVTGTTAATTIGSTYYQQTTLTTPAANLSSDLYTMDATFTQNGANIRQAPLWFYFKIAPQ